MKFSLPNNAAPRTPLASPYNGFRKIVFKFGSLINLEVICLISSKKSISFETPPPKTIASGSIVVIIITKALANFTL